MAWVWLVLAGLGEVGWAITLKSTEGFTKLGPSALTATLMIASFALLGQALKALPLGTAYAVWTGIGAVGTVVWGILFLGEPKDALRLVCLGLIVSGVLGLKLVSSH